MPLDKMFRAAPVAALLSCASAFAQTAPSSPPSTSPTQPASAPASDAKYLADFAALQMALQQLDDASALVQMSSLAQSGGGRDVFMLTLAADTAGADARPAVMIVAGFDARHRVGVETALRVAQNLVKNHADLLKDATFYIVPCANPDGYQFNVAKPNVGHVGNMRKVDTDRDGAVDEDGPTDVNGDGVVTQMRRVDPPLDDRATHMADPNEPRLLKRPDAAKGEKAVYSLYVEGLDVDGDGLIGEDGPGEVDLDRNFMHRYPEHAMDAGSMPLSEPETLALADFVIRHKNLTAVITYGRHDNLINVPDGRGTDISGQGPRDLDAGDVEYYREVAKKYKELTGQARAAGGDTAGAFEAWVYAQRGIPSFASTVWGRPDPKEEPRTGGGGAGGAGGAAKPRDPVTGDWSGSVAIENMGDVPYTFTLTLAPDNTITGSTTTMGMTVPVSGTFDPASGKAKMSGNFGGQTAEYEITFKTDELTGTYSMAGESLAFGAKRAPAANSGEAKPQAAAAASASETPAPAAAAQEAPQQGPPAGGRRGGGAGGAGRRGGGPPTGGGPGAGAGGGPPGSGGGDATKPEDAEGAAWLKYSDTVRNHEGFIEWKTFDHPTLGKVEVGGFVPGFQMNPPAAELDELGAKQTLFVVDVIGRRPSISVQGPSVEKLADGLYEVRLGIVNAGYLPTATAMARKARSIFPSVVRISTPIDNIVTGDRVTKTYGIGGSGDRVTYRWIIRADDGSDVTIDITNPHLGDQHLTFKAAASTN